MCWYCSHGWHPKVQEIHDRYEAIAGESAMHYGPAHIVWDDENFEREHVQWCLDEGMKTFGGDFTKDELDAVRASLVELLALPDDVLDAEAFYGGARPPWSTAPEDLHG